MFSGNPDYLLWPTLIYKEFHSSYMSNDKLNIEIRFTKIYIKKNFKLILPKNLKI